MDAIPVPPESTHLVPREEEAPVTELSNLTYVCDMVDGKSYIEDNPLNEFKV